MKVSKEAMAWYKKADQVWTSVGETSHDNVSWKEDRICFKTASRAAKAMWKSEFPKQRFPYEIIKAEGRRYSWVRRNVLSINTQRNWAAFIHDFGHWMGIKHQRRNKNWKTHHCAEHAIMEWKLSRMIVDKGYIDKSKEQLRKGT